MKTILVANKQNYKSASGVLTVKVLGLIVPPLAQMTSTKACYKLGLMHLQKLYLHQDCFSALNIHISLIIILSVINKMRNVNRVNLYHRVNRIIVNVMLLN